MADETTSGKLERMEALRDEARHQGSEKAVASSATVPESMAK